MKVVNYAGVSLMVILAVSCSGQKNESAAEREIPVKVVEVVGSGFVNGQSYVGTVEEESASLLSFQVMGNVERIFVREGQQVSRGQLLASLEQSVLQDTYDAALASLGQAQDASDRMKILYENFRRLNGWRRKVSFSKPGRWKVSPKRIWKMPGCMPLSVV